MKKAFTIVEILIVMAIIGLLTALLLWGIPAVQRSARNSTRQNDMRSIKNILEAYHSTNRKYPIEADLVFQGSPISFYIAGYAMNPVSMSNTYVKTGVQLADGCTVNNVYYKLGTITGVYDLFVCLEDQANSGYSSDDYGNK